MPLLQLAFWIFVAGAAGGGVLLALALMGRRPPAWSGPAHGLVGAAALATLGLGLARADELFLLRQAGATAALVATLAAGLFVSRLHFPGREPLLMAIVHGSLAVLGLVLLYRIAF